MAHRVDDPDCSGNRYQVTSGHHAIKAEMAPFDPDRT
jgi:hypothetical protein